MGRKADKPVLYAKVGRMVKIMSYVQTKEIARYPIKARELKRLISEYSFALRLAAWLCLLPIIMRLHPLPEILQRFTSVRRQPNERSPLEMDRAVQIVVRICRLGLFHLPLFPRACLRQSLALYFVLTRMGYPVEIHFGIRKDGEDLGGHSWVTLDGKPVADRTHTGVFAAVYSYPPISRPSMSDEMSQFLQSVSIQMRR
jgi:Transglutaminase-like superfamily